jgi:hypothetical protein
VHEDGYRVAPLPDGTLEFRRPDGRVLPDVPLEATVPGDPLEALITANIDRGLQIDARTALPEWRGERVDVGYVIDVLHPRAAMRDSSERVEIGEEVSLSRP